MQRYVHTVFCEDIRPEIDGKFSLMGIVGGSITLPQVPLLMPKLCAVVWISSPTTEPFSKVRIRLLLNEDTLLDATPMEQQHPSEQLNPPKGERMLVITNVMLSPFQVTGEGILKVRVNLDDGPEMKGGALKFKIDTEYYAALTSSGT